MTSLNFFFNTIGKVFVYRYFTFLEFCVAPKGADGVEGYALTSKYLLG